MLFAAIVLALVAGVLMGGRIPRLANLDLRWPLFLFLAFGIRVGAQLLDRTDLPQADSAGSLALAAYVLLLVWLWFNRHVPGLEIAGIGVAANAIPVLVNAGRMPVWDMGLRIAGLSPADLEGNSFHFILKADTVGDFVIRAGPMGDVIPLPIPFIRDVVSIGDLLLALGIFLTVTVAMTQPDGWRAGLRPVRPFGLGRASRPAVGLGAAGGGVGSGGIGQASFPGSLRAETMVLDTVIASAPMVDASAARPGDRTWVEAVDLAERRRIESPYLRLLRNRDFSLLWVGQAVSLFGDRLHQVAVGFVVYAQTGSALSVGLTFAAASAPNFLLGPIAGAFVDRWDRKRAMVVSDLVRAGLVLLVPIAIGLHVVLVYVIAFAIATVTLVFRPAKTAALPLVVDERDLVTANSASSISETGADLIGYPLAGLLVASMSGLIGAVFFIDSATYVISAALIAAMSLPATETVRAAVRPGVIWAEMMEGWRFLRGHAELFSNTLVSVVTQVAVGTQIAVSLVYAESALSHRLISYPTNYAVLEASIAVGSLLGGFWIGALASRFRKGHLAVTGFLAFGLLTTVVGFVDQPLIAFAVFAGLGVANMVFVIANMTLFQQRTPQNLMGRVVSIRHALVFGVMTAAMAASGALAAVIGPQAVFLAAGVVSTLAAVGGLLAPAMRNAE